MAESMTENLSTIKCMGMDSFNGMIAALTKEVTYMILRRVMESIPGLMASAIKETG